VTPEGKVKALVKTTIEEIWPNRYQFMPVQNGMGSPSLDFLFCIKGLWIAIETKEPGKSMTPRQTDTAADMIAAGGLVFMVDGKERLNAAVAFIRQAVARRVTECPYQECPLR
jgi:hypothetical protein